MNDKRLHSREQERLTRYQYQHRGLNFTKLWLPPSTDRRVNIIGQNEHIYRGHLPTLPMDQLPSEVDSKSIDPESLYKELFNMKFPAVTKKRVSEGPSRRIGGPHTTSKRLYFAPVRVQTEEYGRNVPILGADGNIYRGTSKPDSVPELEQRLKGTKRPVRTAAMLGSAREHVEPAVVSLFVDGKPPVESRPQVPLIQVPISELNKMIRRIREQEASQREMESGGGTSEGKGTDDAVSDEQSEEAKSESGDEGSTPEPSSSQEVTEEKEAESSAESTEGDEKAEPEVEADADEEEGNDQHEEPEVEADAEEEGNVQDEEPEAEADAEEEGKVQDEEPEAEADAEEEGNDQEEEPVKADAEEEEGNVQDEDAKDEPSSNVEEGEKEDSPKEVEDQE